MAAVTRFRFLALRNSQQQRSHLTITSIHRLYLKDAAGRPSQAEEPAWQLRNCCRICARSTESIPRITRVSNGLPACRCFLRVDIAPSASFANGDGIVVCFFVETTCSGR